MIIFQALQLFVTQGELVQPKIHFIQIERQKNPQFYEFLYQNFGHYYPSIPKINKIYNEIYAYTYSKQKAVLNIKQILRVLQKKYSINILQFQHFQVELYYLDRIIENQTLTQPLF